MGPQPGGCDAIDEQVLVAEPGISCMPMREALLQRPVRFDQVTAMGLLAVLSLAASKKAATAAAIRRPSAGLVSEARLRATTSAGNSTERASIKAATKSRVISG